MLAKQSRAALRRPMPGTLLSSFLKGDSLVASKQKREGQEKDSQQRAAHTLRSLASAVRGRLQGGQCGSLRMHNRPCQLWVQYKAAWALFQTVRPQCTT